MNNSLEMINEGLILNQKVKPHINEIGYRYIKNQVTLNYSNKNLRVDAVVYLDNDYNHPFIIIEIKSLIKSEINIFHSSVQNAFIAANALGDSVKYILVTDGDKYFWFERDIVNNSLVNVESIPNINYGFENKINIIERDLIALRDIKQYHNILMDIFGEIAKDFKEFESKIVLELNKILISKLYDEQCLMNNNDYHLRFKSSYMNEDNIIDELNLLYKNSITDHNVEIEKKMGIMLTPKTAMSIVRILESFAISTIPNNLIGDFFWEIFPSLLIKREGKYLTPKYISEIVIKMAHPIAGEKILDPTCGSGLFITESHKIMRNLNKSTSIRHNDILFTGIEIDKDISELALTNFMLSGIDNSRIINTNSLSMENIVKYGILENTYDLIVSNPPFGLAKSNEYSKSDFEIAYGINRIPYIALFIELSIRLLKDGGRLVVIVPDSFLEAETYINIRNWIAEHSIIKIIVSLPLGTFVPMGYSIKTSILLLEKRNARDDENALIIDLISIESNRDSNQKQENDLNMLLDIIDNFHNNISNENIPNSSKLIFWELPIKQILLLNRIDIRSLYPKSNEMIYLLNHSHYPIVELEDIVEIISNPFVNNIKNINNNSIPLLLINSRVIHDFYLELTDKSYIQIDDNDIVNKIQVMPNDIVIVNFGKNVGQCAVIDSLPSLAVIHNSVFILRPKKVIDPFYIVAVLCSQIGKEQIRAVRSSIGIERLHKNNLSKIRIPLPPLEHQRQISSYIKNMLDISMKLTKEANDLENYARNFISSILIRGDSDG